MPRLFVALDAPEPIRSALASLEVSLPGARWTPPERMHLTLFFIGETTDEQIPAIEAALATATGPPVPVVARGLGAFPNPRAARVLVATVDVHPALDALQGRVAHALTEVGAEAERRPFHPHLTLARLKNPDRHAVRAFLERPFAPMAFEAEAFHLVVSEQTPEGPRYRRLRSFPLGG